jgi:hypothetical protein
VLTYDLESARTIHTLDASFYGARARYDSGHDAMYF